MQIDFPLALPFPLLSSGKVRDLYDLGSSLLMVVSDRVSAFDVVFTETIPDKGKVLNSISLFFFDLCRDLMPNHVITATIAEYPASLQPFAAQLAGRSMLVKKAQMLPCECIVRGYLEGSALKSYRHDQTVNGELLPAGLCQGAKLPQPIFTPSTKAESGHDQNITQAELRTLLGTELAEELKQKSLALYERASTYAASKGLILADCKFEFGFVGSELCICDELFTPDSSRFWEASSWEPGRAQQSYDKQFLREYLEGLNWDKQAPAPTLPAAIVENSRLRYLSCLERLTGSGLVAAAEGEGGKGKHE